MGANYDSKVSISLPSYTLHDILLVADSNSDWIVLKKKENVAIYYASDSELNSATGLESRACFVIVTTCYTTVSRHYWINYWTYLLTDFHWSGS